MRATLITEALAVAGDPGPPREQRSVGGGSISQALYLRTAQGEYLLKVGGQGLPGFFAAEAHGLGLLAATRAVLVPGVLACKDGADHEPGFILLEWLGPPRQASRARAVEQLGAALAELHRAGAPAYGLDRDNYIGATPQPNGWHESWLAFFRDQRLAFQIELARRNGHLDGERSRRAAKLLDRLDTWIDEHAAQPALLHGDLWSGNVIVGPGGAPALIDPAVYYGDREAELAFTALFGGFPESFYRAYEASWPLADGWRERRDLYNLYHLLNHLNLFGESYGAMVDGVLRQYA